MMEAATRPIIAAGVGVAILVSAGCASSAGYPKIPVGLDGTVPPQNLATKSDLTLPGSFGAASYDGQATVTHRTSFPFAADRFSPGQPAFAPTVLVGSPGQHITLLITNKTPTTHNFTLEAEHINKDLAVGATISVPVTFPTKGAVIFYCRFHASEGQAGELIAST